MTSNRADLRMPVRRTVSVTEYLGGALVFLLACSNPQHGSTYSPDADNATGGSADAGDGSGSGTGSGTAPLDCSTRPPPAGWPLLTSGRVQSYSGDYHLFDIADATKFVNMWGFNTSAAPVNSTIVQVPYVEPEGAPPPIIHPVFPAHMYANALFGYGSQKGYYSLELTVPTFPDPGGAQSLSFMLTGSSSNYGATSTVSFSQCPGDFSPDLDKCINSHFFGEAQTIYVSSNLAGATGCQLDPGKTYYLNIAPAKEQDWTQSSCPAGAWCWTTMINIGANCIGAPDNSCEPLEQGL
jgi:hypothetical protein